MAKQDTSRAVAQALLDIEAVQFVTDSPLTLKSGMRSPLYVDNRVLPFHPESWKVVLSAWQAKISEHNVSFDCLAGIETAGIPHSATLGFLLEKPSVFIRKKAKDHGTKSKIEGGDVTGKSVLLIEDHVTTGGSSLAGVQSIRDAGGQVDVCLSITWYDFLETRQAFDDAGVALYSLVSVSEILDVALERKTIAHENNAVIREWLVDPHGWSARQKD
ncbi:MAG: orotate phosphoribosyltransferase [Patescibacteria group bacterium]